MSVSGNLNVGVRDDWYQPPVKEAASSSRNLRKNNKRASQKGGTAGGGGVGSGTENEENDGGRANRRSRNSRRGGNRGRGRGGDADDPPSQPEDDDDSNDDEDDNDDDDEHRNEVESNDPPARLLQTHHLTPPPPNTLYPTLTRHLNHPFTRQEPHSSQDEDNNKPRQKRGVRPNNPGTSSQSNPHPHTVEQQSQRIQLFAYTLSDGWMGSIQRRMMGWPSLKLAMDPKTRSEVSCYPDGIPPVYLQWRLQKRSPINYGALNITLGPRSTLYVTPYAYAVGSSAAIAAAASAAATALKLDMGSENGTPASLKHAHSRQGDDVSKEVYITHSI